jgi:hypothetical protein
MLVLIAGNSKRTIETLECTVSYVILPSNKRHKVTYYKNFDPVWDR